MTKPSIITIDCHYQGIERAAAYLLIEKGQALFIDTNTAAALPYLLDALKQQGLSPANVTHIIPTHLHLDHAGGTSALLAQCPNAIVVSHPRAVRHYADPARLIASTKAVYGEKAFTHLYGTIAPIPPDRIHAVEDNETWQYGTRTLTFLHTPGHAKHHICLHDTRSNAIFTGDIFGVDYRASRTSPKPFILCSTAPTDFDPAETRQSINRILSFNPARLYLAHFGELTNPHQAADVLLSSLDQMETILNTAATTALQDNALLAFFRHHVEKAIRHHAQYCGVTLTTQDWLYLQDHLDINAKGLAHAALTKRT